MKNIFTTILLVMVAVATWAYDAEVDGIYYNLVSKAKTAEVTYKGSTYDEVKSYSGEVTIPETIVVEDVTYSVTSIGDDAFYSCTGLTSVDIPNSVTSIGNDAFDGCTGLTSVTIPNSVTSIGSSAFASCTGLTSVTIGNSVTSIGNDAFFYCTGLTSVTIPNSVTSIGVSAFSSCYGLTSVNINDISSWCKITFSGSSANPLYCAHHLYMDGQEVKDLVIPESVTSIGNYAFEGCSGLTSVTIPNSVTSIGYYAFYGCSGLTSVTIPNSVTSIGDDAFNGCTGLTKVIISDLNSWCNIDFSLGDMQFDPSSNPLCNGGHLYLNGAEIIDLVIPNSVTSIKDASFFGCSGVLSLTIPNSVTNIGKYSFACPSLREIHSNSLTPPTVNSSSIFSSFGSVKTANCKLYVPIGTKDEYSFAEGWGDFVNIIEETVVDPTSDISKPTITYTGKKLQFQSSTSGVTYSYTIKADDSTSGLVDSETGVVNLSATYTITAYAQKDGKTSEASTATLVWATGSLNPSSAKEISVDATPLLIIQNGGVVTISGVADGETVGAYTVSGSSVAASKVVNQSVTLDLSSVAGQIAVLKVGSKSAKIMVK